MLLPTSSFLSGRGMMNIGTLLFLVLGIAMLFMGYPILTVFVFVKEGNKGGFGLGGSNASGQVPDMGAFRYDLIDKDTPKSAYKKTGLGLNNDETWNLQFSDEFETAGRSFYAGDDPYWEAVNLYAHGTADYEWYDPAAVTTRNGSLEITCTEQNIHNLRFRSGQVTTWNKMCYTGGILEAAVILPGDPTVSGWWPAIWTMGNLGRANYGATTEGMWPYTYDACDRGALANQTDPDGLGPVEALQSGGETTFNDKYHTTSVSWQPGQRLSSCTCPGEDHPGPKDKNGNYVGRAAPELDLFEAQVDGKVGGSLSLSAQIMPANAGYWLNNASGTEMEFHEINGHKVHLNSYRGNILQQSASGIAVTNQDSYEMTGNVYSIWAFEYEPGDDGYVTWWIDGKKAWTMHASASGPDARAGISQRPIPREPMVSAEL
jgi:beta-glucanase (GH16 family)